MGTVWRFLKRITKGDNFAHFIQVIEIFVAKVLSLAMVGVIVYATGDLIVFLIQEIVKSQYGTFYNDLFKLFGLFLNILIALEVLENITGYMKKHVIQAELVIVTSLIAVARKIIILDLQKISGVEIIGLAVAILALSISYLIVRHSNTRRES